MFKKTLIVVLVLLAAFLTVGAASADTLAGRGWVKAEGNGTAVISGNVATMILRGTGSLWYKDEGDPDRPFIRGYRDLIRHPNGWVEVVGFDGIFHLDAADQVTVKMTGKDIKLLAAGKGRVILRGRGHYVYGKGDHVLGRGDWGPDDLTVDFGE